MHHTGANGVKISCTRSWVTHLHTHAFTHTHTKQTEDDEPDTALTAPTLNVFSDQLIWRPMGEQATTLAEAGSTPRVVHKDILLAKLKPGQRIKLEGWCRYVGTTRTHTHLISALSPVIFSSLTHKTHTHTHTHTRKKKTERGLEKTTRNFPQSPLPPTACFLTLKLSHP